MAWTWVGAAVGIAALGCSGSSGGTLGDPPANANVASEDGGDACAPKTCGELGVACGRAADRCGGELDCGACSPSSTDAAPSTNPPDAGGAGADASQDRPGCVPVADPCKTLDSQCGPTTDGCGGYVDCGGCAGPFVCVVNTCMCAALHSTADGGCR